MLVDDRFVRMPGIYANGKYYYRNKMLTFFHIQTLFCHLYSRRFLKILGPREKLLLFILSNFSLCLNVSNVSNSTELLIFHLQRLTLSHIQTLSDTSAADGFLKTWQQKESKLYYLVVFSNFVSNLIHACSCNTYIYIYIYNNTSKLKTSDIKNVISK